jgi:hypothetical protein
VAVVRVLVARLLYSGLAGFLILQRARGGRPGRAQRPGSAASSGQAANISATYRSLRAPNENIPRGE